MVVVADASPFVGLIKIGQVDILRGLFGAVVVPTQVRDELMANRTIEVSAFAASPPSWLSVKDAAAIEAIDGLGLGERAAIGLAKELDADLLLIDESHGREAAMARNIKTVRTASVIRDAADVGLIADLGQVFRHLKMTNFRVPHYVLDQMLEEHLAKKADRDRP